MITRSVPLSRLVATDEVNSRVATSDGLDELAASIAAKGLIQPLIVRQADGDKLEIVDGRRRYMALRRLVKDKRLPKSAEVDVVVRDEEDGAAFETSLAANLVRLPPHPVDQHEAFARLARPRAEGGAEMAPADIAARFGIAERTVRQHLALGRLAPEVRTAWRRGKLSAETAQAFAIHPDAAVQAATLETLTSRAGPNAVNAYTVRKELSDTREAVDECIELRFVGEETYRQAGGTITDDLFSEARYVDDVPLVKQLARAKLQDRCKQLVAEGWAWAEVADEGRNAPHLQDSVDGWYQNPDPEEVPADVRAKSGCIVDLEGWGDDPEIIVHTCLQRREPRQVDLEELIGEASGDEDDDGDDPGPLPGNAAMAQQAEPEAGPWDISGALIEDITRAQTTVVAEVLARDPDLALRVAVAALTSMYSPVRLTAQGYSAGFVDRASLKARLAALREAAVLELAEAVAPAVAQSVDLVAHSPQWKREDEQALVAELSGADYLAAMRTAFSAADFFARSRRETAIAALDEMTKAGATKLLATANIAAMKKGELAEAVAREAKAAGWLPPQLRHPEYALRRLEPPDEKPSRARRGKMAAAGDDAPEAVAAGKGRRR